MSLRKWVSWKLKALRLSIKKCDQIIENRDKQTIERQRTSVVSLAGEIDQLRGSIQESKSQKRKSKPGQKK